SFAASCAALLGPQDPPQPASTGTLRLLGVTVHTGTDTPWTGVLGARHGRLARPDDVPVEHHGGVQFELPGAFVTAGIQDAHGHLLGLGSALVEVDLVGTTSFEEVVRKAAAAAEKLPKGAWVLGRGWDQNDWADKAMPHHRALSAAVPDHPVWLTRVDGHAGLANQLALAAAKIGKGSVAPSGGEILFDDDGQPTGVLIDNAMAKVPEPALSAEELRARLLAAQQACFAAGLTCVHDAGVSRAVLDAMVALHGEGRWGLRTYVMLAAGERELIARGPWQTPDGLITVRAVKGYADGALGSRGAVLLEPYADRPAWKGLFLTPEKGIAELAQRCAEHGMQLCTHAIGDAANRAVLDAYAAVQCDGGLASRRFRVEHAQVIAEDDFARFRSLGVLPSMQPTHLTSDMPWAPQRLGPARTLRAYAYRRFHALGLPVPFGSDFPVESVDPRKGFYAAATTRAEGGDVELRPDQKLSRAEVIRGFTAHAAYGMFAEKVLGTVEAGKIADLTVWDTNLLTCPDAQLLTAKVLLTIVGGRVVYDGRPK
ncbi:MAG: amidohydrolase, partial [Planctomycetes bacterium]|nr:amidohydrolase [Planctomycetota bacterium]